MENPHSVKVISQIIKSDKHSEDSKKDANSSYQKTLRRDKVKDKREAIRRGEDKGWKILTR